MKNYVPRDPSITELKQRAHSTKDSIQFLLKKNYLGISNVENSLLWDVILRPGVSTKKLDCLLPLIRAC
jgi:hypothetical protein